MYLYVLCILGNLMRTYLESVDLDSILNSVDSCEGKTSLLEQIIKTGLDHVMPMRTRKVHSTEPPWITASLKNLLQKRQCAWSRGDDQMFCELRNRVNRKRKMCRANYYRAKVEHLRKCKPSEWWKEVKKLSGRSLASSAQSDTSTSTCSSTRQSPFLTCGCFCLGGLIHHKPF